MTRGNICFLLLIFICGCAVEPIDDGIVRIRLKEDPTTLDPAYIVDVAGGWVAAKLYNGLVRYDEKCEIVPDIASEWEISKDGLTYTFKLRPDIRFSDGGLLKADAVKKSIERVMAESPRKWIFSKVSDIKVIDEKTLRIALKERSGLFLNFLALPSAYISPDGKTGTGPYVLRSWEHDKKILLEPNPYYFGDHAKVKGLEYVVIPEEFSAQTEFELGNLDIMEVSPIQWKKMSDETKKSRTGGYSLHSQVGLNTYYIGFNLEKTVFKNVKIRQAFNYAIDKNKLIKNILQGQGISACGPVPPVILTTKRNYEYKYLPNKAKKLMRRTNIGRPIKLYVRSQSQAIQIAEVIQYYLRYIGVAVDIVPLEWSAFKKAVNEGETDLFLMSWWADYPDPENFLFPCFYSSNKGAGGNRTSYSNKEVDSLIEAAQKEMDSAKRGKMFNKLQRYINRQAPWIFLWHAKELFAVQSDIKKFKLYAIYCADKGTDIENIESCC